MPEIKSKLFSKQNKKYIFVEITASIVAAIFSPIGAIITDKFTDYDILISVISAVAGTAGFVIGFIIIYVLLNIRQYIRKNRCFSSDMSAIFKANLHGILAMYAFRIPFQYILQKCGVPPAYAALISQFISGLIATAVRAYHNYKANIIT